MFVGYVTPELDTVMVFSSILFYRRLQGVREKLWDSQ